MKFTHRITVTGALQSSFVFQNEQEVTSWINNEYPKLESVYGKLELYISKLDGLQIGDTCHVTGEGDQVFTIVGIRQYSPHSWGFVLDSGWCEEASKCYSDRSIK